MKFRHPHTVVVFVALAINLLSLPALAGDPPVEWLPDYSQRLIKPNSLNGDDFGTCVSMESDLVVVGRPGANHGNGDSGRGDAHVYRWNVGYGHWEWEADLVGLTGLQDNNARFGTAVHTDGNRIIVGAPYANDTGTAWVFALDNGVWTMTHTLSWGNPGDALGSAVNIQGNWALTGAPNYPNGGQCWVWDIGRSEEGPRPLPQPPGRSVIDNYAGLGAAIARFGSRVVIGAPMSYSNEGVTHGTANVYQIDNNGNVTLESQLPPQGDLITENSYAGTSVDIDGDHIAVGAPANYYGSAPSYVQTWTWTGNAWAPNPTVVDVPVQENTKFGDAVSLNDGRLAVGATHSDDQGSWSGHVSMFEWSPSGNFWVHDDTVLNFLGSALDHFGTSISLDSDRMLVGAPGAEIPTHWWSAGAAFYYGLREDGTWQEDLRPTLATRTEEATITDPSPGTADNHIYAYATELARDGNTLLVGEPDSDTVHVYTRTNSSSPWTLDEVNTIQTPAEVNNWGSFGKAIALDDDMAFIGATDDQVSFTGTHVWRYIRNPNGSWSAPLEILNDVLFRLGSDIAAETFLVDDLEYRFVAIGLPGTLVPVGAEGKVAMVIMDNTQPIQVEELTDPNWDGAEYTTFGLALDMTPYDYGMQLAVGNTGDDGVGSVQVFGVSPGSWWNWVHTASLNGDSIPGLTHSRSFGSSVDFDGDYLAVGDFQGSPREGAGQVSVFERNQSNPWFDWNLDFSCVSPFEIAYDHFGADVVIQDDGVMPPRLTVGAPGSNYAAINAGALCTYSWNDDFNDWYPTELLIAKTPVLHEGLGGALVDDNQGVLAGCTSWFGTVEEARVLEFTNKNYATWNDTEWGDLSDVSNWDNPPSSGFTNALFSLLLDVDHTVWFDMDFWPGSMEFEYDHMSLKLTNSQHDIVGEVLIAGDPIVRSPQIVVGGGALTVQGGVTVGSDDGETGTLLLVDIEARVHGPLTIHKGGTLAFDIESTQPSTISVESCDLGGTLDVGGWPSDLDTLEEGDQFVLLQSDTVPTDGLFDLVVLPGLRNGLAFQLNYGAPGARGSCPGGLIEDCYGNCAPAGWVGDGYCDDGTYDYPQGSGNYIYFNCPEFNCDGNDCGGDDCTGDATWEVSIEVVSLAGLLEFGDPNSVTVPGQPTAVEVVDLNHDSADEICVTFAGAPGTLAIFENDGSGGVAQQILLPVHDGPIDLTSGDFDGDGNMDLAIAHHLSQDVVALYNEDADPSDGFTEQVLPAMGPVNCVTRADVDQIFPMDIMACIDDTNGNGEGAWQWWLGQAALRGPGGRGGGLGGGGNQGSGPGMVPVFADPADDEDQKDHVVHGGTSNGRSMVVKGNQAANLAGQGTFVFDTYPVGANPGSVASGDFNSDGHVDLAYTSITNGTVVILLQDPASSGDYLDGLSIPIGDLATDITSIDFDSDGNMDLAAVIQVEGEPRVRVLQNDGNLFFTTIDTALDEGVVLVDAGDVSGNSDNELVTVGGGTDNRGLSTPSLALRANTSITCPGDTDYNGVVNVDDLINILAQFGPCPNGCTGDFDNDGAVTIDDLLTMIGAWGPCPR